MIYEHEFRSQVSALVAEAQKKFKGHPGVVVEMSQMGQSGGRPAITATIRVNGEPVWAEDFVFHRTGSGTYDPGSASRPGGAQKPKDRVGAILLHNMSMRGNYVRPGSSVEPTDNPNALFLKFLDSANDILSRATNLEGDRIEARANKLRAQLTEGMGVAAEGHASLNERAAQSTTPAAAQYVFSSHQPPKPLSSNGDPAADATAIGPNNFMRKKPGQDEDKEGLKAGTVYDLRETLPAGTGLSIDPSNPSYVFSTIRENPKDPTKPIKRTRQTGVAQVIVTPDNSTGRAPERSRYTESSSFRHMVWDEQLGKMVILEPRTVTAANFAFTNDPQGYTSVGRWGRDFTHTTIRRSSQGYSDIQPATLNSTTKQSTSEVEIGSVLKGNKRHPIMERLGGALSMTIKSIKQVMSRGESGLEVQGRENYSAMDSVIFAKDAMKAGLAYIPRMEQIGLKPDTDFVVPFPAKEHLAGLAEIAFDGELLDRRRKDIQDGNSDSKFTRQYLEFLAEYMANHGSADDKELAKDLVKDIENYVASSSDISKRTMVYTPAVQRASLYHLAQVVSPSNVPFVMDVAPEMREIMRRVHGNPTNNKYPNRPVVELRAATTFSAETAGNPRAGRWIKPEQMQSLRTVAPEIYGAAFNHPKAQAYRKLAHAYYTENEGNEETRGKLMDTYVDALSPAEFRKLYKKEVLDRVKDPMNVDESEIFDLIRSSSELGGRAIRLDGASHVIPAAQHIGEVSDTWQEETMTPLARTWMMMINDIVNQDGPSSGGTQGKERTPNTKVFFNSLGSIVNTEGFRDKMLGGYAEQGLGVRGSYFPSVPMGTAQSGRPILNRMMDDDMREFRSLQTKAQRIKESMSANALMTRFPMVSNFSASPIQLSNFQHSPIKTGTGMVFSMFDLFMKMGDTDADWMQILGGHKPDGNAPDPIHQFAEFLESVGDKRKSGQSDMDYILEARKGENWNEASKYLEDKLELGTPDKVRAEYLDAPSKTGRVNLSDVFGKAQLKKLEGAASIGSLYNVYNRELAAVAQSRDENGNYIDPNAAKVTELVQFISYMKGQDFLNVSEQMKETARFGISLFEPTPEGGQAPRIIPSGSTKSGPYANFAGAGDMVGMTARMMSLAIAPEFQKIDPKLLSRLIVGDQDSDVVGAALEKMFKSGAGPEGFVDIARYALKSAYERSGDGKKLDFGNASEVREAFYSLIGQGAEQGQSGAMMAMWGAKAVHRAQRQVAPDQMKAFGEELEGMGARGGVGGMLNLSVHGQDMASAVQITKHGKLNMFDTEEQPGLLTTLKNIARGITGGRGHYQAAAAEIFKGGEDFPQVPGFKDGGTFTVGGSFRGPDTEKVEFMATPGEQVFVMTPKQLEQAKQESSMVKAVLSGNPGNALTLGGLAKSSSTPLNVGGNALEQIRNAREFFLSPSGYGSIGQGNGNDLYSRGSEPGLLLQALKTKAGIPLQNLVKLFDFHGGVAAADMSGTVNKNTKVSTEVQVNQALKGLLGTHMGQATDIAKKMMGFTNPTGNFSTQIRHSTGIPGDKDYIFNVQGMLDYIAIQDNGLMITDIKAPNSGISGKKAHSEIAKHGDTYRAQQAMYVKMISEMANDSARQPELQAILSAAGMSDTDVAKAIQFAREGKIGAQIAYADEKFFAGGATPGTLTDDEIEMVKQGKNIEGKLIFDRDPDSGGVKDLSHANQIVGSHIEQIVEFLSGPSAGDKREGILQKLFGWTMSGWNNPGSKGPVPMSTRDIRAPEADVTAFHEGLKEILPQTIQAAAAGNASAQQGAPVSASAAFASPAAPGGIPLPSGGGGGGLDPMVQNLLKKFLSRDLARQNQNNWAMGMSPQDVSAFSEALKQANATGKYDEDYVSTAMGGNLPEEASKLLENVANIQKGVKTRSSPAAIGRRVRSFISQSERQNAAAIQPHSKELRGIARSIDRGETARGVKPQHTFDPTTAGRHGNTWQELRDMAKARFSSAQDRWDAISNRSILSGNVTREDAAEIASIEAIKKEASGQIKALDRVKADYEKSGSISEAGQRDFGIAEQGIVNAAMGVSPAEMRGISAAEKREGMKAMRLITSGEISPYSAGEINPQELVAAGINPEMLPRSGAVGEQFENMTSGRPMDYKRLHAFFRANGATREELRALSKIEGDLNPEIGWRENFGSGQTLLEMRKEAGKIFREAQTGSRAIRANYAPGQEVSPEDRERLKGYKQDRDLARSVRKEIASLKGTSSTADLAIERFQTIQAQLADRRAGVGGGAERLAKADKSEQIKTFLEDYLTSPTRDPKAIKAQVEALPVQGGRLDDALTAIKNGQRVTPGEAKAIRAALGSSKYDALIDSITETGKPQGTFDPKTLAFGGTDFTAAQASASAIVQDADAKIAEIRKGRRLRNDSAQKEWTSGKTEAKAAGAEIGRLLSGHKPGDEAVVRGAEARIQDAARGATQPTDSPLTAQEEKMIAALEKRRAFGVKKLDDLESLQSQAVRGGAVTSQMERRFAGISEALANDQANVGPARKDVSRAKSSAATSEFYKKVASGEFTKDGALDVAAIGAYLQNNPGVSSRGVIGEATELLRSGAPLERRHINKIKSTLRDDGADSETIKGVEGINVALHQMKEGLVSNKDALKLHKDQATDSADAMSNAAKSMRKANQYMDDVIGQKAKGDIKQSQWKNYGERWATLGQAQKAFNAEASEYFVQNPQAKELSDSLKYRGKVLQAEQTALESESPREKNPLQRAGSWFNRFAQTGQFLPLMQAFYYSGINRMMVEPVMKGMEESAKSEGMARSALAQVGGGYGVTSGLSDVSAYSQAQDMWKRQGAQTWSPVAGAWGELTKGGGGAFASILGPASGAALAAAPLGAQVGGLFGNPAAGALTAGGAAFLGTAAVGSWGRGEFNKENPEWSALDTSNLGNGFRGGDGTVDQRRKSANATIQFIENARKQGGLTGGLWSMLGNGGVAQFAGTMARSLEVAFGYNEEAQQVKDNGGVSTSESTRQKMLNAVKSGADAGDLSGFSYSGKSAAMNLMINGGVGLDGLAKAYGVDEKEAYKNVIMTQQGMGGSVGSMSDYRAAFVASAQGLDMQSMAQKAAAIKGTSVTAEFSRLQQEFAPRESRDDWGGKSDARAEQFGMRRILNAELESSSYGQAVLRATGREAGENASAVSAWGGADRYQRGTMDSVTKMAENINSLLSSRGLPVRFSPDAIVELANNSKGRDMAGWMAGQSAEGMMIEGGMASYSQRIGRQVEMSADHEGSLRAVSTLSSLRNLGVSAETVGGLTAAIAGGKDDVGRARITAGAIGGNRNNLGLAMMATNRTFNFTMKASNDAAVAMYQTMGYSPERAQQMADQNFGTRNLSGDDLIMQQMGGISGTAGLARGTDSFRDTSGGVDKRFQNMIDYNPANATATNPMGAFSMKQDANPFVYKAVTGQHGFSAWAAKTLGVSGLKDESGRYGMQQAAFMDSIQGQLTSAGISAGNVQRSIAFTTGQGLSKYKNLYAAGQPLPWSIDGATAMSDLGQTGGFWGIEDAQTKLQRKQEQVGFQRSADNRAMQIRQYMEGFDFNRNWQNTQRSWQLQDFSFKQQDMGRERTWAMQDFSLQRSQSQRHFGWQMEDFNENLRYATGRERRQMEKQKSRTTIDFNEGEAQAETQNKRQREMWRVQDQRFEIEKKRAGETFKNNMDRADMEKRHFLERMAVEAANEAQQIAWAQERIKLEDDYRQLQRTKFMEDEKSQLAAIGNQVTHLKNQAAIQANQLNIDTTDQKAQALFSTAFDNELNLMGAISDHILKLTYWVQHDNARPPAPELTPPPVKTDTTKPKLEASGGMFVANKPTLLMVGEDGSEVVSIKNHRQSTLPNFGEPQALSGGGAPQVITVNLILDNKVLATETLKIVANGLSQGRLL